MKRKLRSRKRSTRRRSTRRRSSRSTRRRSTRRSFRRRSTRRRSTRRRSSRSSTKAGSTIFEDTREKDSKSSTNNQIEKKTVTNEDNTDTLEFEILAYDFKEKNRSRITEPGAGKSIDSSFFTFKTGKKDDKNKYNTIIITKKNGFTMKLLRPFIVKLEKEKEYKIVDLSPNDNETNYVIIRIVNDNADDYYIPSTPDDSPQTFIK